MTQKFRAVKRTTIDGVTWWVVWDNAAHKYSSLTCFGRYRRKRDCEWAIGYYSNHPFWGRGIT